VAAAKTGPCFEASGSQGCDRSNSLNKEFHTRFRIKVAFVPPKPIEFESR
jgi:hypothetical protein